MDTDNSQSNANTTNDASSSKQDKLAGLLLLEKGYSEKIVATVREGLLILKTDLTVDFANRSFYQMFHVEEEETLGSFLYNLGNGQWDIPQLRILLEEMLPQEKVITDFRVEHTFETIGRRVMLLNARQLDTANRILLAVEDVTKQIQYEEELQQLNQTLSNQVQLRTAQVLQLTAKLLDAEQLIRDRIAQRLHDELQQIIYAVKLQLVILQENPVHEESWRELGDMVQEALRLTHQLTEELQQPALQEESLHEALGLLAEQMAAAYELNVTFEDSGSQQQLDEEQNNVLYEMVRELLFNIVKHAGVKEAAVTLQREENGVTVTVSDRGKGFELAKVDLEGTGKLGLRSMSDRVKPFHGRVYIDSEPGVGTHIVLFLPRAYLANTTKAPAQGSG